MFTSPAHQFIPNNIQDKLSAWVSYNQIPYFVSITEKTLDIDTNNPSGLNASADGN